MSEISALEFARMKDGSIKVGYNPRTEEGGWVVLGDVTEAVKAIENERDEALAQLANAKQRFHLVRKIIGEGPGQ